jgi:hypothetical protein
MKKKTAHTIMLLFDAATLAACYYAFSEWQDIHQSIKIEAQTITVQSPFGIYILMLMMPIIHGLTLIDWRGSLKKWINRLIISIFLLMVVGLFFLNSYIDKKIVGSGYIYCAKQSEFMTFSKFNTYVREKALCTD